MLSLYRRHLSACRHFTKGREHTRCSCPVWCDGQVFGVRVRRSLDTRDWTVAAERARLIEGATEPEQALIAGCRLSDLIDRFMENGHRAEHTIANYKPIFARLLEHLGNVPASSVDHQAIRSYLAIRKLALSSMRTEIAILRALFNYAVRENLIERSPAQKMVKPPVQRLVTKPFDKREIALLLEAARADRTTRALILTAIYTGLRISDLAQLKRGAYDPRTGYLTLPSTQKTGAPIRLLLNQEALQALDSLPRISDVYWFWSGKEKVDSCVKRLREHVALVGEACGIKAAPHRFRDTFAVELLTAGADIRTVQMLLGHASVQVTERHYAHFVQEHQKLLDSATTKLEFGSDKVLRPLLVNADRD
jgi:integrase/recombinase XerD